MTTETMTIHRGLAELKVIEDRINKLLREAKFCAPAKKSMKKLDGVDIDEFKTNAQSVFDKITALISKQAALKRAISESNAKTYVTVAGINFTVAMAIWMNQHGIDFQSALLNVIDRQYSNATAVIENANARLSDRADSFVSSTNSASDKNNMDADTLKEIRQDYIDRETMVLVDGIDVKKVKNELADKIDKFKAEVDAALSASNAVTEITIEY